MTRTRAYRRHHRERMKRKAKRLVAHVWRDGDEKLTRLMMNNADNLKVCSCEMCGNPRKWFKQRTRQEVMCE